MRKYIAFIILMINYLALSAQEAIGVHNGTATGTNTYSVTINSLTKSAITEGQKILVKFPNANTAASSLVVTVAGGVVYSVKDIETNSGAAISSGTIQANSEVLMVYNSSFNSWQITSEAGRNWSLPGNSGTTMLNFLGTTDNKTLRVRTNNTPHFDFDSLGRHFIYDSPALADPGKTGLLLGGNSTSSYIQSLSSGRGDLLLNGLGNLVGVGVTVPKATFHVKYGFVAQDSGYIMRYDNLGGNNLLNLSSGGLLTLNGTVKISGGSPGTGKVLTGTDALGNATWQTPSGGSTTLTFASPLSNSSGTVSITSPLPIVNGGTNATTANAAFNNLAPSQTSNSGKYLTTDGTNTSWGTVSGGGTASVTITDDNSTNSTMYPVWSPASSGTQPLKVSSTGIAWNPNSQTLSTINGSMQRLECPLFVGGVSTTATITYKTTVGVGATGADHIFQVGNNGATEALRILNNGDVGIGISPTRKFEVRSTAAAQMKLSYDASNYTEMGTASNGNFVFDNTSHLMVVGPNVSPGNLLGLETTVTNGAAVKIFSTHWVTEGPLILGTFTNRLTQLYLGVNGNVGLSNTSPAEKLDVTGNIKLSGSIKMPGSSSGTLTISAPAAITSHTLTLPANAGTNGYVLSTNGSGTTSWIAPSAGGSASVTITDDNSTNSTMYPVWSPASSGTQPLKVSSTGIAWNPNSQTLSTINGSMQRLECPLFVGGVSTTATITYKTTVGVGATGADHIFQVGNNGATEALRILNSGNVGINKSSPTEKLDVFGNIRFSGALMPNNTAGSSGQVLTSAGAGVVPTWTTPTTGLTGVTATSPLAISGNTISITSPLPTVNGGLNSSLAGTSGQTLRSNGTAWIPSSLIYNDGTYIGINNTSPAAQLDVASTGSVIASNIKTVGNYTTTAQVLAQNITAEGAILPTGLQVTAKAIEGGVANAIVGLAIDTNGTGYNNAGSFLATKAKYPTGITASATGGTNAVGLTSSASGGTNNYAALFPAGSVGIGTNTPTAQLSVIGTASTSATSAVTIANSDGTAFLTARNDKVVIFNEAHLKSTQATAPTCTVTGTGITSAATTTGSTDTRGVITTVAGAPTPVCTITLTFNTPYANAPFVLLSSANSTGGAQMAAGTFVSSITTTGFTVSLYGANSHPEFSYIVIE